MTAAAFSAAYADFKLIKTRGVVSISFEVPVEQAQAALDVLGGMPVAATEVWCAVARLDQTPDSGLGRSSRRVGQVKDAAAIHSSAEPAVLTETPPRQQETVDGAKTKTAFRDMRPANQAGILCETPAFQKFIAEKLKYGHPCDAVSAANYVRRCCNVASRSDIRPRTPSGDRWKQLFDEYQTWMHVVA